MQHQTDDVRISEIKELLPPVAVLEKFPATEVASSTVFESRQAIHKYPGRAKMIVCWW